MSEFVTFTRYPFCELEFHGVSPFWLPGLLTSTVSLLLILSVAFTVGTVGFSTFSAGDFHNFAPHSKEFIAAKNGDSGLLLVVLTFLTIAGCIVVFIVAVIHDNVVWVPVANRYLR